MERTMNKWILIILVAAVSSFTQALNFNNPVVFKVGSEQFTKGKVDTMAAAMAQVQLRGRQATPAIMEKMKQVAVMNLISQELIALEAEAKNIKAPKAKVDKAIATLKAQTPSEKAFNQYLAKIGVTYAQFKSKIERQLAVETMLEQVAPYPKAPTQADMKAYYTKHKATAIVNDSVVIVQVYFDKAPGQTAEQTENNKAILSGLAAQAKAGVDIRKLAAQYSSDPEAKKTGGILGPVKISTLPKSYQKQIKKLKVGEISKVFTGPKGRLVVMMLQEKNDGTLESNLPKIQYLMGMQAEQTRMMKIQKFLDSIREKYPVEFYDNTYKPAMNDAAANLMQGGQ